MAAGKSTVGPLLADRLGWRFIDFDSRIEEQTGLTPGELIRARGEAAFRQLEAAVTDELAGVDRVVLAPGGGWATRPDLVDRLGAGTVRVWLRVTAAEAIRRAVADEVDRPLLGPSEGRAERAAALLRSREASYARSEVVVNVDDRGPAVVVDEILRRLASRQEGDEH